MSKQKKIILSIVAILLLILVTTVVYFFVIRTTDNAYNSLSAKLESLDKNYAEIENITKSLSSSTNLTVESVTGVSKSSTAFKESLSTLSKDQLLERDNVVKRSFTDNQDKLNTYAKQVAELSDSLRAYSSIAASCGELVNKIDTIGKVATFDSASEPCNTSISSAKKLSNTKFGKQYLANYSSLAQTLLEEYRKMITQVEANAPTISTVKISETLSQIEDLRENKLALEDSSGYVSAIRNIRSSVSQQKTALFR